MWQRRGDGKIRRGVVVAEVAGTAAATGAVTGVAAAVVVVVVVMKAVVVVVMVRGVAVVVVMMVDTCLMRSYFRRWIGGYERYAAHRGRVRVARMMALEIMQTCGSLIGWSGLWGWHLLTVVALKLVTPTRLVTAATVARRATMVGMVTAGRTAAAVVVVVWAAAAGMGEVLIVMGVMVG